MTLRSLAANDAAVHQELATTLLLASSFSDSKDELCGELLCPDGETAENVLWISYTTSPDAQLRRWRAHGYGRPANLGIISVGESTRSAVATAGSGSGNLVETVSNPNDLTGLGIRINQYLSEWEENEHPTTVCFDSLTAMLQYVDLETTYEFLHILAGRLYAADAAGHFHMDPGAHDEQIVETVISLCDAVVDATDDEDVQIRTR